jgi:DNA modification methylase
LTVAYVWHASAFTVEVKQGLERIGFDVRQQIIWAKTNFAWSRSAYHWQHEPCWYAVRKGSTANWHGPNNQTTLWEAASPKMTFGGSSEQKYDHPTQKPTLVYDRPIANHTLSGDPVYEPFSGSGTAIAACEQLSRRCFAMEVDPKYVDVAVRRWEEFTGEKAELQRA